MSRENTTRQALVELLVYLLHSKKEIREQAELELDERAKCEPGFIASLIVFACLDMEIDSSKLLHYDTITDEISREDKEPILLGSRDAFTETVEESESEHTDSRRVVLRCLATVIANLLFDKYWKKLYDEETSLIKTLLLNHLISLPSKILNTLHLIVAKIASIDEWPQLFPTLRYLMNQCRERHSTQGTLALLRLLKSMTELHPLQASLVKRLLSENTGVQDALLHLIHGMPQFNFDKQKEVAHPHLHTHTCTPTLAHSQSHTLSCAS